MNAPPPIHVFGGNARANDSPRYYADMPQHSTQAQHWYPGDAEYGYDDEQGGNPDPDLDNDNDGGESREAKRRRIARACDMCRKKKVCRVMVPECNVDSVS